MAHQLLMGHLMLKVYFLMSFGNFFFFIMIMYCWYFYTFIVFWPQFGDSLFDHSWSPNRCYHSRSGWILEQWQLRGGSMLLQTSQSEALLPDIVCHHTQDNRVIVQSLSWIAFTRLAVPVILLTNNWEWEKNECFFLEDINANCFSWSWNSFCEFHSVLLTDHSKLNISPFNGICWLSRDEESLGKWRSLNLLYPTRII